MWSDPRNLERALTDLIKRRNNNPLTPDQRTMLDRMIADLEAEIALRRRKRKSHPVRTRSTRSAR